MMKPLFWVGVAAVLYAYAGYPLMLWVLSRLRPRPIERATILPTVSVIIAARNEEGVIKEKIANTLALAYPPHQLEIIVASDASDDATHACVREFADRGVRLVASSERRGKEYAQRLAIQGSRGEIFVFSDASVLLDEDALRLLVENFADPTVGAVSSEDVSVSLDGERTPEGLYVRYEMMVRRLESRVGSLVGLSGSCFAIRRDLCMCWPEGLASDFMAALHAARAGYRAVVDPRVRAYVKVVGSPRDEFRRKRRTFLRGITVLMDQADLINPVRFGFFALELLSHKLLRFAMPGLLMTTWTSSLLLSWQPFYAAIFALQTLFYGLAIVGRPPASVRAARAAHYVVLVNLAVAEAWGRYLIGDRQVVWEPSKR